jgi:hypothetical protein
MTDAAHTALELDQLRQLAAAREFSGRPIGVSMSNAARHLARDAKRLGSAGEAWMTICPSHLLEKTAILGLTRGELRIAVADSAAMYELDRFLRCGGEATLARASSAPINRVRLVLDARPFASPAPRKHRP